MGASICHATTCRTNESFGPITVTSSKGRTSYNVSWRRLYGKHLDRIGAQFGPHCTCKGFDIRSDCRHVKEMEKQRCGWNAELEPTAACNRSPNGEACCPQCGGPVSTYRVAV
jgi:hypothetical protein